ncbi:phage tail tape measure protein [Paenibacillus daejeonensis]|uniref:phage tail tape measure protein n=1 Tax=Paenibacillus daejeonensis TaxID=135193 RepID=UPI00037EEF1C|nr:phage tail tape measure protein [Paenibacillus daejeonensis]
MAKVTATFEFSDLISRKLVNPLKGFRRLSNSIKQVNTMVRKFNRTPFTLSVRDRATRTVESVSKLLKSLRSKVTSPIIRIKNRASPIIKKISKELDSLNKKAVAITDFGVNSTKSLYKSGAKAYEMDSRAGAITGLNNDFVSDSVKEIYYHNNAGTSREKVVSSIAAIAQQTNLGDDSLVEAALLSSKVNSLIPSMKDGEIEKVGTTFLNAMGVNFEKTLDSLMYVHKNGGDMAKDLMPTLTEYAATFAELGISPDQLASGLVAGQKAGAHNYRLLADAIQEWGSLATADDSSGVLANILGKDRVKQIKSDNVPQHAIMAEMITGFSKMDALQQEKLGKDLFGSGFEEHKVSILEMARELANIAEVSGELNNQFNQMRESNPFTVMNDLVRASLLIFEDIGKAIMKDVAPAFQELHAWMSSKEGQEAIAKFSTSVTELGVALGNTLANGIRWVVENWEWLLPILKIVGSALFLLMGVVRIVGPILNSLGTVIKYVRVAVSAVTAAVGWLSKGFIALINWGKPLFSFLGRMIGIALRLVPVIGTIVTVVWAVWEAWKNWESIMEMLDRYFNFVSERINGLKNILDDFNRMLGRMGEAFEVFKEQTSQVMSGDFKFGLPKWMGGAGFIQLNQHAKGISNVPFDNYPAALHKGETVLPRREAELIRNMASGGGRGASSGSIIVQISGDHHYSNNQDAERVANTVLAKIENALRDGQSTSAKGVYA